MKKFYLHLKKQSKNAAWQRLGVPEFAALLGVPSSGLGAECRQIISTTDFRFRYLASQEYEEALLLLLKQLDAGQFNVTGPAKKILWNRGWEENYRAFQKSRYEPDALIPKYFRPGQMVRYQGRLVVSPNQRFEYDVFRVVRSWLINRYLGKYPAVYEYGCGTGQNLVAMAQCFPEKKFYGFDWSDVVHRLFRTIHENLHLPIQDLKFDMFHPGKALRLEMPVAAVTFDALEQLGSRFKAFYHYLWNSRFAVYLHVEPVIEFYDENLILDYLAIRHHRMRNLLDHYLTFLRKEAAQGRVVIDLARHIRFGSVLEEGWNVIIWRNNRRKLSKI